MNVFFIHGQRPASTYEMAFGQEKVSVVRVEGQWLYTEEKGCTRFSVDRVIGKEVQGG